MHSEKTIYNYFDYSLFSVKNLDLPRKVRYRPRKKGHDTSFKVEEACRIGRTYDDFLAFMEEHPDTPVVQMDSAEDKKGGKIFLTIHFIDSQLMLVFIRDANTSRSVAGIFQMLFKNWVLMTFEDCFRLS